MRTAITTAITHDGKDVLLFGKTTSLLKQKEELKKLRGKGAHEKYREVSYQESDGHEQLLRFRTPEQEKKHQDLRASEMEAARKAGEAEKKAIGKEKEAEEPVKESHPASK